MMSFDERLKCLFSFLISPSVTLVDDCSFLGFGSLSHISAGFIKDNKVQANVKWNGKMKNANTSAMTQK